MSKNKKLFVMLGILLILAGIALTYFIDEKISAHAFFHMFLVSVVLFALVISIKDIIIILMISASAVWALGMFDILHGVYRLMAETAVIIGIAAMLGWKEFKFKSEKEKQEHVLSYKKDQVSELKKELETLNSENHDILEEIKKHRKKFAG